MRYANLQSNQVTSCGPNDEMQEPSTNRSESKMDVVCCSQIKQLNQNQTKIVKIMKLHRGLWTITAVVGTSSFASASSNAPLSECEARADIIKNLCIGAGDEGDNVENFVNFLRILDRSDIVDLPDACTLIASRLLNPRVVNQRFSLIRDNHNTICHMISTCMVDNDCVDGDDIFDTYDSSDDDSSDEEDPNSELTPTLYDPVSQHPHHVYDTYDSSDKDSSDEDAFEIKEEEDDEEEEDLDEDEDWRGFHPMYYDDEDENDEEGMDNIPSLPHRHQPYNGPGVKGPKKDEMRPPNRRLLRGSKPQ